MKQVFAAILFFPFALLAQDCGLKKTTDPFTHVDKLSTGFKNFNSGSYTVLVSADAAPTEIDFFFWIKNANTCFDAESDVELVYEGERSRSKFSNSGSTNCEGAFHFTIKNTPTTNSYLNKLSSKKVATIKLITTTKKEIVLTLSEEQKVILQNMAACMATEGKTLLKK